MFVNIQIEFPSAVNNAFAKNTHNESININAHSYEYNDMKVTSSNILHNYYYSRHCATVFLVVASYSRIHTYFAPMRSIVFDRKMLPYCGHKCGRQIDRFTSSDRVNCIKDDEFKACSISAFSVTHLLISYPKYQCFYSQECTSNRLYLFWQVNYCENTLPSRIQ